MLCADIVTEGLLLRCWVFLSVTKLGKLTTDNKCFCCQALALPRSVDKLFQRFTELVKSSAFFASSDCDFTSLILLCSAFSKK